MSTSNKSILYGKATQGRLVPVPQIPRFRVSYPLTYAMITTDPDQKHPSVKAAFFFAAGFILLVWTIWIVDAGLHLDLYRLGVYPHTLSGLGGIAIAPLIHASAAHLFANTPALLVLGTALVYGYPHSAGWAFFGIYILSGLGIWLLASVLRRSRKQAFLASVES